MAGLGKQSKRKGALRAADMSAPVGGGAGPAWYPPPPEECEDLPQYTIAPDGADAAEDHIKVRIRVHASSQMFTEFALIQQTYWDDEWRDVAVADSCHDDEVHIHRYARRTKARVGEPEVIAQVRSLDDLQKGYDLAYTRVFEEWSANRRRWERA